MDPNTALSNLRDAMHDWDSTRSEDAAQAMADAIDALDGWLTRGGFLPTDWAAKR